MNDYQRVEQLIRYIDDHRAEQPDLDTLAEQVGLSAFHLHRMFSKWAGITPKAFLKCLNLSHARSLLDAGGSVLDTALDTGLSGPGRLHDLCVSLEAASPGEVKSGGAGWAITAGFADTPFGTCLIGQNTRGICHLSFVSSKKKSEGVAAILSDWPKAEIQWNDTQMAELASNIFAGPSDRADPGSLKALVRGTEFQVRVWRALLEIPSGTLTSYSRIAQSMGSPGATRAIASAIAKNSVAFLIPCHRVIRETGVIGEYRWGRSRKKAIVAWECRPQEQAQPSEGTME